MTRLARPLRSAACTTARITPSPRYRTNRRHHRAGDRPEYYGDTVITGEVRNRVDRLWDLDGSRFSADQIHFVNLIVDELTANGIMEPVRLFEPPYTDHAPTGPDYFFPERTSR